jgi:hypothetical protein
MKCHISCARRVIPLPATKSVRRSISVHGLHMFASEDKISHPKKGGLTAHKEPPPKIGLLQMIPPKLTVVDWLCCVVRNVAQN